MTAMTEEQRGKGIIAGLELGLKEPISENLIASLARQVAESNTHCGNVNMLEKLGAKIER